MDKEDNERDVSVELQDFDADAEKEKKAADIFNIFQLSHFLRQCKDLFFSLVKSQMFLDYVLLVVPFYVLLNICNKKIESYGKTTFVFFLVLVVLVFICRKKAPKSHALLTTIAAFFITNVFAEIVQKASIVKRKPLITMYSNLFPLLLFLPGALELRFSPHYLVGMTTMGVFYSLVQFYSSLFRGSPFRPKDVFNLDGAFQMRHDYSLVHPKGLSHMAVAFLAVVCIARYAFSKDSVPVKNFLRKCVVLVGSILLVLFSFGFKQMVRVLSEYQVIVPWDVPVIYPRAGNFLAFYIDIRELSKDSAPPGYKPSIAEDILAKYESKDHVNQSSLRKPNIIAIMCESFADYKILDNFETNQDYMPFIRSLKENTVKGYVSVSAYGGLSCNSEYEFLTGNSMGFYLYGTSAYDGLTNEKQEALTFLFNDLGYNTIATACTKPHVWHVKDNYKKLHFNESYFAEEFYKKTKTHNGRVLDKIAFDAVVNIYNHRPRDKPLFIFLTTIQNHAKYQKLDNPTVYGTEYKDVYELSSYLTGLKLTDDALKDLIAYFSKVKEDVLIVFYGDHHPHLPAFTEKHLRSSTRDLPLEKRTLLQTTPYFIWTNYPSESQQENMSLSYLSSKVFDVAGFPRTTYMNFLEDTKKHLPMLNPFGYKDSKGVWHSRQIETKDSRYLKDYFMVQHYMINDYKKKN